VVPGETGLLVPPADPKALAESINQLLRDRELGRKMGKAGRKRVEEHFSWRAIATQTKAMYAELLAGLGRKVE
jgi:glycosyltransferase involved in cell wall biosynthesis